MSAQLKNFPDESLFEVKVVHVNRCTKVVKGGRRFSFSAIVVAGDKKGLVGVGLGKANELPDAIKKGGKQAKKRKNMVQVPLKGETIPHTVLGKFGASLVLMKPARKGTGVIASPIIRAILGHAGIQDVFTKSIRRNNPHNVVRATLAGLRSLRLFSRIAKAREKTIAEILN